MTRSLLFALPLLVKAAAASSVLFEMDNAHATLYYDLTNQLCGDTSAGEPFYSNWAVLSGINSGIPKCEQWAGADAKSLQALGTNRIVAMDAGMIAADPDKWCGKEVVITDPSGKKLELDEGPLFIWDGCDACQTDKIVDVSARVFTTLKGGSCAGNNPAGLKVQVLDNNIWQPISNEGYGGPVAGGDRAMDPTSTSPLLNTPLFTGTATDKSPSTAIELLAASAPVPTTTPSMWAASATSAKAAPPGPGAIVEAEAEQCTFGEWSCDGQDLRICRYVTTDTRGWHTVQSCDSLCEIDSSGSIHCD